MKNSTVLFVIGILGLGGVGAYLYLKGKKAPTLGSVADQTLGLAPKDDTKLLADLGVKVEEPKQTPYVAPVEGVPLLTAENLQKALLALGIDQTRSITELSSPNYIEAKRIAGNMKEIDFIMKTKLITGSKNPMAGIDKNLVSKLSEQSISTYGNGLFNPSVPKLLVNMTQKVNALGYKVLPNFDIEKM
jgi:hypothetical protein